MTAPSTIGALQTTICPWRSGGSISIAISLLVSAPPRSTRMATPVSDQAWSMAPHDRLDAGAEAAAGIAAAKGERHLVADHLAHHVGRALARRRPSARR